MAASDLAVWKRDGAKATLSRRVVELEQSLGVRLIERALRLTEEGRALHERTHSLLAQIDEAGEAITSRAPVSRPSASERIGCVRARGTGRTEVRFALAYPQLELEIVAEDRMVHSVQDGYDLVIRVNPARTNC